MHCLVPATILLTVGTSVVTFFILYLVIRARHTEVRKENVFSFKIDGVDKVAKCPEFLDDYVYIEEQRKYVFGKLVKTSYKLKMWTPSIDCYGY